MKFSFRARGQCMVGLFCSAPQIREGTSCMLLHLQQSKIESQLLKQVFVVLCKTMLEVYCVARTPNCLLLLQAFLPPGIVLFPAPKALTVCPRNYCAVEPPNFTQDCGFIVVNLESA